MEVWRAAWIAVYMADLEKGGIASGTTGEAVKRLSNVRRMPEYSVEA